MVTLNKDNTGYGLEFYGLSTDTKPVGFFENSEVTNGSYFFEMDTQEVYFYDEATKSWLAQP